MNKTRITGERTRGVVLFVVLIVLVAMTIGAAGLMRSVDTSTLVSGNLAFKKAALTVADSAVQMAVAQLPALAATPDVAVPAGCDDDCLYYPTMRILDGQGVPTATALQTPAPASITQLAWPAPVELPLAGYTARYVVERLCRNPLPVSSIATQCFFTAPPHSGSHTSGTASMFAPTPDVYYRITVRVDGPRGTQSFAQVIWTM